MASTFRAPNRAAQQAKAAAFKARKKREGKFGGVTGRESPAVAAAIAAQEAAAAAPTTSSQQVQVQADGQGVPPAQQVVTAQRAAGFETPQQRATRISGAIRAGETPGVIERVTSPAIRELREREAEPLSGRVKEFKVGKFTTRVRIGGGAAFVTKASLATGRTFLEIARGAERIGKKVTTRGKLLAKELITSPKTTATEVKSAAGQVGRATTAGAAALGTAAVTAVKQPRTTAKKVVKFVKDPTKVGEFAGGTAALSGGLRVTQKAVTAGARFAPGFVEVPFIQGLEKTRPQELVKGIPKETPLFSVTPTRTSFLFPGGELRVKPKGGVGAERAAFAKKTGVQESFFFFSPEKASLSFTRPQQKGIRRLTERGFRVVAAKEKVSAFKEQPLIKRAIAGTISAKEKVKLRAKLARETIRRKTEVFPGTKGAAGLGTEREVVLGTGGKLKRVPKFQFTVDPFGRFIKVIPATVAKETRGTPSITTSLRPIPKRTTTKTLKKAVEPKPLTPTTIEPAPKPAPKLSTFTPAEKARFEQLRAKQRGDGLSIKELSEIGKLQEKTSEFARAQAKQAKGFFDDVVPPKKPTLERPTIVERPPIKRRFKAIVEETRIKKEILKVPKSRRGVFRSPPRRPSAPGGRRGISPAPRRPPATPPRRPPATTPRRPPTTPARDPPFGPPRRPPTTPPRDPPVPTIRRPPFGPPRGPPTILPPTSPPPLRPSIFLEGPAKRERISKPFKTREPVFKPSLIGLAFPKKFKPISKEEAKKFLVTGVGIRPQVKGEKLPNIVG